MTDDDISEILLSLMPLKDPYVFARAIIKQAKREALLEAAAYCDDFQIGSECNLDIASGLRCMVKELE
jgi:hypothetical protein